MRQVIMRQVIMQVADMLSALSAEPGTRRRSQGPIARRGDRGTTSELLLSISAASQRHLSGDGLIYSAGAGA